MNAWDDFNKLVHKTVLMEWKIIILMLTIKSILRKILQCKICKVYHSRLISLSMLLKNAGEKGYY